MSFENLKPANDEGADSNLLQKEDLVNEIIAIDIVDYDPQYEGKFGKNPRITVDMIVCTGKHKGTKQDSRYFSFTLAEQMYKAAGGSGSTIVRIVSGPSKYGAAGSPWFGVRAVTDAEFTAAADVVKAVLEPASGRKSPF